MGRTLAAHAGWRPFGAALAAAAFAGPAAAGPPQYYGFSWLHGRSAASTPYAFANIDARPVYVADPVADACAQSVSLYESDGVSSILGFNDFLYGEDNATAVPRPDAIRLFDAWWSGSGNRAGVKPPWVVAIWPADEALLRCNGASDVPACLEPYLDFVSHIRDAIAGTGVVLVDSFDPISVSGGALAQQAGNLIGAGIRWFGYHQYGVLHPLTDAAYGANVAAVRQVVEEYGAQGYGTRFVLVGDGFHDAAHTKVVGGNVVPWDWSDHRSVVDEDFQVACRNDAVALILFNWPDYRPAGEDTVLGSVSFQDPSACWEACLGRLVKFGETVCDLCGGGPAIAGCRLPRSLRRHLRRP